MESRRFPAPDPTVGRAKRIGGLRSNQSEDVIGQIEGNDQLKTNVVLEMESHGIQFRTV